MPGRFLLRALVAVLIYCCIIAMFYWSPWLSGKGKPYLHAALTESIDFVKIKAVIADLFSYSSVPQTGNPKTQDLTGGAEPVNEEMGKAGWPAR
ncbi:MAG: hypothetical protein GX795_07495 [Firmicutes bacterium]|nr:hypothetical protein [Bacillota bacterium]